MSNSTDSPEANPFALSATEEAAYGKAKINAQNQISSVLNAWLSAGMPFPDGPGFDPITNITIQIVSWGNPPPSVDEVRNSRNLQVTFNNSPLCAAPILYQFQDYLNATSSVSEIQQKLVSQLK